MTPHIPEHALIIMDNAPYHHALSLHSAPTATAKRRNSFLVHQEMAFPFETIVSKPNEWKFSLKGTSAIYALDDWLPHKGTRSYARRPTP